MAGAVGVPGRAAASEAMRPRSSRWERLRTPVALGALFVLTTVLMYRPNPAEWGDVMYGVVADPAFTTWLMLWDAHALHTDPIHVFSAPIFWPHRLTLAYSDNLLPLVPFFTLLRLVT